MQTTQAIRSAPPTAITIHAHIGSISVPVLGSSKFLTCMRIKFHRIVQDTSKLTVKLAFPMMNV